MVCWQKLRIDGGEYPVYVRGLKTPTSLDRVVFTIPGSGHTKVYTGKITAWICVAVAPECAILGTVL